MNASDHRPIHQLVKAVLGERNDKSLRPFDGYIEQNPSVFDLIKLGAVGLQQLGLDRKEAHALMARGNAMALYVARLYREQSLRAAPPPDDEKTLVTLPSYKEQFNPDIDGAALPGSPEHIASTTAYMVALREWVQENIVPKGEDGRFTPLQDRRPDVDALLIDEQAINQVLSRLQIANLVLEALILSRYRLTDSTVKSYLRTIRFHNSLPYDHDWESITHVAATAIKNGTLGDVVRRVDQDYPYFKNANGRGSRAEVAMQLNIGIGPLHLALLLEDPYFKLKPDAPDSILFRVDPLTRLVDPNPQQSATDFYLTNFGSMSIGLQNVRQLWVFKDSTRLSQREVDCLFAIGPFTPTLSSNAPLLDDPDVPVTGVETGARYIHGAEAPAIELIPDGIGNQFRLHHVGEVGFAQFEHRMDRINRKCRLDRMLQLPSYEVDQLLIAAMNAERRGTGEETNWIRANTLRCLGLFKELNNAYGCKAEEFSALIDVLSVYGQDGQPSHFDRVYNRENGFEDSLRIDGENFAVVPRTHDEQQTVHQICSALEINFETYRYLASVIANAYGLTTHLTRTLPILSSFWRLVWVGRLFGVTPIESTALLQSLGNGDGMVAQLACEPVVSDHGSFDGADALSAIRGLMSCAKWCREYELPPLWLMQNVSPVYVPTVWTESQEQFLRQLRSQASSVLVEPATLLEAGAPLRDSKHVLIDWMQQLSQLVDSQGVVIGSIDETQAQYEARIELVVVDLVATIFSDIEDEPKREPLKNLIVTIVLRCRDEQRVVVEEGLAVYLRLDSLLAAQVLGWAQGHPYEILAKAMPLTPAFTRVGEVPEKPDSFLQMLAELERRGRIAARLELSPAMLKILLTGEQYLWFSLNSPYEISLRTVYYLAFYRRLISRARQPEEKMLDYLTQVNTLPTDMSEDGLLLVRDAAADKLASYLGCGIRHVLECAAHISESGEESDTAPPPILCTLAHLDLLDRTLELARNGMDATAALALGRLYTLDQEPAYAAAAQNALESLARFNAMSTPQDSAEVGQSFTSRCVVDNPILIANVSQEVATYRITLTDFFGKPLRGVVLYIGTDLGAVLTPEVRTDDQGCAWAQLQAGKWMGTAHLHYRVPLYEPVYAPSVLIDCDEPSLQFNPQLGGLPPKDAVLAGRLWAQEIYAVLSDAYGNRGANRQVAWSTTVGEIRPAETYTDKDGVSRVWISSLSPGDAFVTISNVEGSHSYKWNRPIVFDNIPRIFDAPAVLTPALINQALRLNCQVVGLDDLPVEGETVVWSTSANDEQEEIPSDDEGFSEFTVVNPPKGPLVVYAKLGTAPAVEVSIYVADDAVIQSYSAVTRFPVAGAERLTLLWVDVTEGASDTDMPVPRYPVKWKDDSRPDEDQTFPTDAQGRSVYAFKSDATGVFTVTAELELHPSVSQTFELTVVETFIWKVELCISVGNIYECEEIIPGMDELILYRDAKYWLKISTPHIDKLQGRRVSLGWSSEYSTRALGMEFTPTLGTELVATNGSFEVAIDTRDKRNGRFQLILMCDALNESLVLEGTLTKRPFTRRLPSRR
ncbi:Tc toxin subunit A [Pseudomonas mandelii]|uniref:Tc toxin subunit A n=1 Tax=Pseudomonas mandelii TaxID=75612 RepID=UPI00209CC1B4|nr:Tc toxin subunit A [Pseudomonas mandelii]MCO8312360.1 Tc toxin subunit A [Pseudomonas mandelii]